MISDLFSWIYPKQCIACASTLTYPEDMICLTCESGWNWAVELRGGDNVIEQLFWGKCVIYQAGTLFNFVKGESIQKIIHQFKYNGNKKTATKMGNLMAVYYARYDLELPDYIIAAPSTKKKLQQRGYNQAAVLAKAFALELNLTFVEACLFKDEVKGSQTDKNVLERYLNMEKSVRINPLIQKSFEDTHVLIIDDVITTGSTLIACCNALQKKWDCKVSIFTLAYRNI